MKKHKLILMGLSIVLAACSTKPQNQQAAEADHVATETQVEEKLENVGNLQLTDMNRDRVSIADELAKNKINIIDFKSSAFSSSKSLV